MSLLELEAEVGNGITTGLSRRSVIVRLRGPNEAGAIVDHVVIVDAIESSSVVIRDSLGKFGAAYKVSKTDFMRFWTDALREGILAK
jgi:hypothetical protein